MESMSTPTLWRLRIKTFARGTPIWLLENSLQRSLGLQLAWLMTDGTLNTCTQSKLLARPSAPVSAPLPLICELPKIIFQVSMLMLISWVYSSLQPKEQLQGHNYYEVNPAHLKVGSNYTIGYNGVTSDSEGLVYTEDGKLLYSDSKERYTN